MLYRLKPIGFRRKRGRPLVVLSDSRPLVRTAVTMPAQRLYYNIIIIPIMRYIYYYYVMFLLYITILSLLCYNPILRRRRRRRGPPAFRREVKIWNVRHPDVPYIVNVAHGDNCKPIAHNIIMGIWVGIIS